MKYDKEGNSYAPDTPDWQMTNAWKEYERKLQISPADNDNLYCKIRTNLKEEIMAKSYERQGKTR